MDFTKKHCVPCEGGTPPLSNQEENKMLKLIRQAQSSSSLSLGVEDLSDNRRQVQHDPSASHSTVSSDRIGSGQAGWVLIRDGAHKIRRQFKFKNFREAISFINKVAEIAEKEGHHPDIYIFYNKVQLDLFTHAVGGLSENDFIMAAKINALL